MSKIGEKILYILLVLLVIFSGLIFIYFNFKLPKKQITSSEVNYSYSLQLDFFDEAYSQGFDEKPSINDRVYAAVVPHHLMVKDKIGATFLGLEKFNYDSVIIIGPNHFNLGRGKIISSLANWQTPYGELTSDKNLVGGLLSINGLIKIEEPPFADEHSIFNLVAFVKKSFPKAKIVPLILKNSLMAEESVALAQGLSRVVDINKTLILVSVDFSHNYPTAIADAHDLISRSTIEKFDFDNIYNLDVDSPPSIYVLLKYLDLNNIRNGRFLFSTNSGRLIGQEDLPTTSHQIFIFTR